MKRELREGKGEGKTIRENFVASHVILFPPIFSRNDANDYFETKDFQKQDFLYSNGVSHHQSRQQVAYLYGHSISEHSWMVMPLSQVIFTIPVRDDSVLTT
jgi:hypothetical protein